LQDCVFLFADEAINASDKAAEARLKNMLTEKVLMLEGKGRDPIHVVNRLHVMMASNERWVIPAASDDGKVRRFFVAEANSKWQGQHDKFKELWQELEANDSMGYRRMLWDLQTMELPEGWHPREIVRTAALRDQQQRSQSIFRAWLQDAAWKAVLPFPVIRGDWEHEPVRVFAESIRIAFIDYCRQGNINPYGGQRADSRFLTQDLCQYWPLIRTGLRDRVPEDSDAFFGITASPSDGRATSIEIPALTICRNRIDELQSPGLDWPPIAESEFG
jgi:hypothetical protein